MLFTRDIRSACRKFQNVRGRAGCGPNALSDGRKDNVAFGAMERLWHSCLAERLLSTLFLKEARRSAETGL